MLIKNKIIFIFFILLTSSVLMTKLFAEEFNISAKEISMDQKNNILTGIGSVIAIDSNNRTIKADEITYYKSKEILKARGSVKIYDNYNNVFLTESATYDKPQGLITTYENSELNLENGSKTDFNDFVLL